MKSHVTLCYYNMIEMAFSKALLDQWILCSFTAMDYAITVFDKTENPDGFLWNTVIRRFVRTNQVDETF